MASKGFGIQVSWSSPQRSGNSPIQCSDQATGKTSPLCFSVFIDGNFTSECSSSSKTNCVVSSVLAGRRSIEVRAVNGSFLESSSTVNHQHSIEPYIANVSVIVNPGPRSLSIGLNPEAVPAFYDIDSQFSQGALISTLEVLAYPAGTAIEEGYIVPTPSGKCSMNRSGRNSFTKGCTISNLTNGDSYDLHFRARNTAGWSPLIQSARSYSHTPTPVPPGQPRNLKITAIKDGLRLSWSSPLLDGGAESLDLSGLGGPESVKVGYSVSVDGIWADQCLYWKTSCEIVGDFYIRPGELQYIGVDSFNAVGASEKVYASGMAFSTPKFTNIFWGDTSVEKGRHRITWYDPANIWNDMGAEITSVEALAFWWDTNFEGATPRPVAKCSVTKSGKKPLAGSCLLPTLPRGTFHVAIRAKNKAGWSEFVWTTAYGSITN